MTLSIRMADSSDAEAIQAIYEPIVRDTWISFELDIPDVAEMRHRIETYMETYPWLVCVDGEQIAGYVYASTYRARKAYQWSVEVTAYIHEDYRRRGIGRALYISLFEILALQGYCNAYAGVALPNEGSIGLHRAMGFEDIGIYKNVGYKFGQWHDVAWLQMALQDYPSNPSDPVKLPQFTQADQLAEAIQKGQPLLRG